MGMPGGDLTGGIMGLCGLRPRGASTLEIGGGDDVCMSIQSNTFEAMDTGIEIVAFTTI